MRHTPERKRTPADKNSCGDHRSGELRFGAGAREWSFIRTPRWGNRSRVDARQPGGYHIRDASFRRLSTSNQTKWGGPSEAIFAEPNNTIQIFRRARKGFRRRA